MKNYFYELAVVFPPAIDAEKEKHYEKIRGLLASMGCEILAEDHWGRTKFAYPIKKETDGFYSFFSFKGENTVPSKIADEFRVDESILRHLLVKKPMSKLKKESTLQSSLENEPIAFETPEIISDVASEEVSLETEEYPAQIEDQETPVMEEDEESVSSESVVSSVAENSEEEIESTETPFSQGSSMDANDETSKNEQVSNEQEEN